MSELPGLFNDYDEVRDDDGDESHSPFAKVVVSLLVAGLIVAFGAIAYFGVGPMLVKPYAPPIQSNAPDVAEVMGLSSNQQDSGIKTIADESLKQQLLQRLAAEVEIPEGEQVSILHIAQKPQQSQNSLLSQAEKDDVLFILMQTGKAYLYRPSTDRVVATGSATIEK